MNGRQYIRFTGVDRRGVSRVGCLHAGDPAQLAERLFDKGYRSASITNFQGDEVGGVCRELDNPRRRTWWAERDPGGCDTMKNDKEAMNAWPVRGDGSPKTIGEMTEAERREVAKRAAAQFQDELDRTAPAIAKVLDETDPQHARGKS